MYLNKILTQSIIDTFDPIDIELAEKVLTVEKSLRQQWPDADPIASDVILWALGKGLIADGSFTRTVLGTVPESDLHDENKRLREQIECLESDRKDTLDSRGQHHEEKRLAILGFAIKELVLQCESSSALLRGNEVNATALTNFLHERRDELGVPPDNEAGFSFRAIQTSLSKALSEAKSCAKNSVKNTDKK